MAGPPSDFAKQFARLAALPPYVLAAVDELKSKLRANRLSLLAQLHGLFYGIADLSRLPG